MATIRSAFQSDVEAPIQAASAAERCDCCQIEGRPSARLVHEMSGVSILACLRCLRSVMQMRVGKADSRGRRIMRHSAEQMGWHVWRADDALYLLPVVDPFVLDSA